MKMETPVIIEKKLEEYEKLAVVSRALTAFIQACEANNFHPEDMGELLTSMAVRKMRKDLPSYKRK